MGMYVGANKGRLKGCIQHPPPGKRISVEILVGVGLQA